MLVQMAISRSREYSADRMGADISGRPLWLASALAKIQNYAHQIPNEEAEAAPATAHIFIINPLSGRGVDNWFSTHPNTENRIAELEEMAREKGQIAGPRDDEPRAVLIPDRGRNRHRARATPPAARGARAKWRSPTRDRHISRGVVRLAIANHRASHRRRLACRRANPPFGCCRPC